MRGDDLVRVRTRECCDTDDGREGMHILSEMAFRRRVRVLSTRGLHVRSKMTQGIYCSCDGERVNTYLGICRFGERNVPAVHRERGETNRIPGERERCERGERWYAGREVLIAWFASGEMALVLLFSPSVPPKSRSTFLFLLFVSLSSVIYELYGALNLLREWTDGMSPYLKWWGQSSLDHFPLSFCLFIFNVNGSDWVESTD